MAERLFSYVWSLGTSLGGLGTPGATPASFYGSSDRLSEADAGWNPVPGNGQLTQGENLIWYFEPTGNAATLAYYQGTGTVGSDAGAIISRNDMFGTQYYYLTNTNHPDGSFTQNLVVNTSASFPVCFLPGTRIATPAGETAVEDLVPGDLVLTADGRAEPVAWLGRQTCATVFTPESRRPVAIAPGALGDGLPRRELRVTADHALLLDGVLVQAGALVNGTTIRRLSAAELGETFTVFHVECARHEVILAEGAAAESFMDTVTRARFDNFADWQATHGEEPGVMEELPHPRALSARQVPHAIRARIAAAAHAARAEAA